MLKRILNISIYVVTFVLIVFFSYLLLEMPKNRTFLLSTDFRAFYTGGIMVKNGIHSNFYDLRTQYFWQHKLAPETNNQKQLMPFVYPPFVALLFSPLTKFTLQIAYSVWAFLNIVLLVFISRLILKTLGANPLKLLSLTMVLLFMPLWEAGLF